MRILLFFSSFLLIASSFLPAQFVTIPDSHMVNWFQTNLPACISGNQLDTTCGDLANPIQFNSPSTIENWSGVEYITGMNRFSASMAQFMDSVPKLPDEVRHIWLDHQWHTHFPVNYDWPDSLETIYLSEFDYTYIPPLPATLRVLEMNYYFPDTLPVLNQGLEKLQLFWGDGPDTLRQMPQSLREINIQTNNALNYIDGPLPDSLRLLRLDGGPIAQLPAFPDSVEIISLTGLLNLTSLPTLPAHTEEFSLWSSNLTQLPPLNVNLKRIRLMSTQISCLPSLPSTMDTIIGVNNAISCISQISPRMNSELLSLPLCQFNDPVNNPDNCAEFIGLSGRVYLDQDNDCSYGTADETYIGIKVSAYDASNNFVGAAHTNSIGEYAFDLIPGTYTFTVDNTVIPVLPGCNPLSQSLAVTGSSQQLDFSVECANGLDLVVMAIIDNGRVFPGNTFTTMVRAGDIFTMAGVACTPNSAGQLQVTINGPGSYAGPCPGSLVPTVVNGNVLTYDVPSFQQVNWLTDFCFDIQVDTTATIGDQFCITATISDSSGFETVFVNNSKTDCYEVVNSCDPNDKRVWPDLLPPLSEEPLTYLIRFQNIGTAPAQNIKIVDTLDANLRPETFELLATSHAVTVGQYENVVTFKFKDINLIDSLSDPEASQGFVSIQLTPKSGMAEGSEINNRAAIYFDYNAPIITNYATTSYRSTVGTPEIAQSQFDLYPNPGRDIYHIRMRPGEGSPHVEVTIFDPLGRQIKTHTLRNGQLDFDLGQQPAGLYLVRIANPSGKVATLRLVHQ